MFRAIFFTIVILSLPQRLRADQALLHPNPESKILSTSVLIPCAATHFRLIPELLGCYNRQTEPPSEVIVSLSECQKVASAEIESVEQFPWNFQLKIVKSTDKLSAGQNRNVAFAYSTGDLILTQDADDLPHPQRIQVIKYLFENFELDHLLHLWIPPQKEFVNHPIEDFKACYFETYPPGDLINFHNACACMLRPVCDAIKWPEHFLRTEDTEFNLAVYNDPSIKYKALLWADFIQYRLQLSTAGDGK
jgi:glycosyltransferase involved in cell wall biosynthesis